MQWETKRVLLTVKAYPEVSRKYGEVVCLAGITEEGEFIRLFPVPFELFRSSKIPKYSWLDVECVKASDFMGRKESYRIRLDAENCGITVVDKTLSQKKGGRAPWAERNKYVIPLRSPSLEDLWARFDDDRTSLGLIKVANLLDFHHRDPLDEFEKDIEEGRSDQIQKTLYGVNRTILERIPHNFYYRFECSPNCNQHDMGFEDWEVFESFRSWSNFYPTKEILWEKLRQRYLHDFRKKDLHFFVGTHSRWPIWMIVGAYYPPAE